MADGLIGGSRMGKPATDNQLRLWYRKPATEWEETLPIGNGRLGAMVSGQVWKENLQLNEDSLWYGGPVDRHNPEARRYLPEIRRLIMAGEIKKAERLAILALSGTPESQRHYLSLGNLYLNFTVEGLLAEAYGFPAEKEEPVRNYTRTLDLDKALVHLGYQMGETTFSREYFVSAVQQVLVLRLTADQPGRISFLAHLGRGRYLEKTMASSDTVRLIGQAGGKRGMDFCVAARAVVEGGKLSTVGAHLVVEKADAVTLLLAAATTFRHPDPEAACLAQLEKATGVPYESLKAEHIKDYQSFFHRMRLTLTGATDGTELANLPTDERLWRFQGGEEDPGLVALYFHFGRYLLISCSRPGTLPANLQGIWN